MCRFIVSLLLCTVLFSGNAYAQSELLKEAIKERLDQGDLTPDQILIAKKIIGEDLPNAGVDLFDVEWDESRLEPVFSPDAIVGVELGAVDVEGNLIFLGSLSTVFQSGDHGSFLAKYTSNGDLVWIEVLSDSILGHVNRVLSVDIDGFIYIGYSEIGVSESYKFIKYSPSGSDRWMNSYSTGNNDMLHNILVDDDGNIYTVGVVDSGGVKANVRRFRPDGVPLWDKTYTEFGNVNISGGRKLGSAIDRFGNLRVGGAASGSHFVASIDPSGDLDWTKSFGGSSPSSAGPIVDVHCNAYFVEISGFQVIVTAFSSNGSQIYRTLTDNIMSGLGPTVANGGLEIVVDRDGRVHVAYGVQSTLTPGMRFDLLVGVVQVSPQGQVDQARVNVITNYLTTPGGRLSGFELDRFGNPYVLVNRRLSLNGGLMATIYKLDIDNLSDPNPLVWVHDIFSTGPAGNQLAIQDIFVDFGDNIYFVGINEIASNGGNNNAIPRFGKITQPYTAVPLIAKNTPDLQIQNQSLWGEFVGAVSAETSFFQINHADTQFDIGLSETFDIFPFGEFGGSFNLDGSMAMGMGFEATASGGVVDISYPGDLDIAIPGSAKLVANQQFTISAQFDPHSSGNIVADATPELSAGLKANVGLNINSSAALIAGSSDVFSTQLVNANVGWQGLIPGLSMSLPTGNPGSWQDFGDERNLVSGRLTRPLFTSNGAIDLGTGMIQSNLVPEVFFSLRGNMTNYISTYQFGTPTIYGFGDGDTSEYSFGASVNIAQAYAQIELEANQSLTFEPAVSVILEFSPQVTIHHPGGGTSPNQSSHMVQMTQSASGSTWTADVNISVSSFDLFFSNNTVTVRPRSKIGGTLHNRTWVDIKPIVGWETLAAEAHADALGQSLFGFDFCVLCYDVPLSDDIPINLFDSTLDLPDTIVELDPITIGVSADGNPKISGTSRPRVKAFVYDQVDANPFELIGFINSPSKRMLIYGDNFFEGSGDLQTAGFVLCSQGRVELIPSTILNTRTALVEIPNKMRLVPGIARIWAVNSQGEPISDSVDFPIELPVPKLGTAGPNLWAADPRISNIAIDVIDGLTPSGTPSFIARRDYWYVLADMWDANNVGSGTGLFDSFPNYDFTAEPPMPAVLINITESPVLNDTRHHWSFDGDFEDSVGFADGAPGGIAPEFVTDDVPRNIGEAADFSGGKITLNSLSLTPMGTGDYSIAFWLKLNDSPTTRRQIFSSIAAVQQGGVDVWLENGVVNLRFIQGPEFNSVLPAGPNFPTDNQWHHYVLNIDRNVGVSWFIDGDLEMFTGSLGETVFYNVPHSDPVKIGMGRPFANNSDSSPLNGQLGDLNIFNRVISDAEIQKLSSTAEVMPIGRFKQPVENGILYSLMPKAEYDQPKLVSISLDVAGPGGGKSNSIDLTVAAPQPVVSNLIPRNIYPDYGEFVMIVEGPLSVPYFNGFEEERFGNFNKSSIVLLDGIPLATTYVTPGTLQAVVPADLTEFEGNALITVYTPSNGTGYFNSFTGGIIESGGESNSAVLEVQYPTPIITAMSPEVTSKALIDRCPDNPGFVRLKITGENFWPGTTIWVDGVEFVTSVQTTKRNGLITRGLDNVNLSYDVIYTDLSVSNLSRVYSAPVVVMNPDGKISDRVFLGIVDEATYEAIFGVNLPPQSMPGDCK